jgi:hypothetical protein
MLDGKQDNSGEHLYGRWDDADEREYQAMRVACLPSPQRLKKKRERFVRVPIWWAEQACKATRTPKALVCIWLLYLSWKTGSPTFALPNGELRKMGISRETKRRALAALERAGLLKVDRVTRKSVVVTLLF